MLLEHFDNTMMILDVLARKQSSLISINELTKEVEARYGRGYYHTIYNKIQTLERKKLIRLEKIGKATIPRLNLQNYLLLDMLTVMEMSKKQNLLRKYPEMQLPLAPIDEYSKNLHYISSICIIDPERNKRLNRLELLILLKDGPDIEGPNHDSEHKMTEILAINRLTQSLQNRYNIKIDPLIINTEEFQKLSSTDEINPLREMLAEVLAFASPENYWSEISKMQAKGILAKILDREIIPAMITKRELIHNLTRFGYKEFGHSLQLGDSNSICIEYIITAILQNNDIRMTEAIPIILAKNNEEINYRILIFLCQKYNLSGELFSLIQTVNELRGTEKTREAMAILQNAGTEPKQSIDKTTIIEKMKLYNAL